MTAAADPMSLPPAPFGPRLRARLAGLMRLAGPVMLSRAGILALSMADLAMTGQAGIDELNGMALGFSIAMPVMVAGIGAMLGVISVASRRFGAGDAPGAARAWAQGMHLALAAGLIGWAICAQGATLLGWFGQDPALVESGGRAAAGLGWGVPGQLMFMVSAFYLESSGRAAPALVAMAGANAVNLLFNALWIPGMGAEGAAHATSLARWIMAAGLAAWVLRDAAPRALGVAALRPWGPGGWREAAEIRRIGLAGCAAGFFETAAFASLAQAAGLAGASVLAVYSVAHSLESLIFMAALGLATATGVQVGTEMGAGRPQEAAFVGWTGLGAAMVMTACCGVALVVFAPEAAGFYTDDPEVIARAGAAFAIVAASLIFDSGQAVMGQCTRSLGDAWVGSAIFFLAFFGVMAPLGWGLTLGAGMDERGLFLATAAGCITAVSLLGWRFRALARGARPR